MVWGLLERGICESKILIFYSLNKQWTFTTFKEDDPSVCVPLASDSSETIKVNIMKLGTVNASDM